MANTCTALEPDAIGTRVNNFGFRSPFTRTMPYVTADPMFAQEVYLFPHAQQLSVDAVPLTRVTMCSLYECLRGEMTTNANESMFYFLSNPRMNMQKYYEQYLEDSRLKELLAPLSDSVWAFITTQQLGTPVIQFARLAFETFSHIVAVSLSLDKDPEEDTEWLSLNLQINETVDTVFEQNKGFTERVIGEIPSSATGLLRLSLDIIDGTR